MKQVFIIFRLLTFLLIASTESTNGQAADNSEPPSLIYNFDLEQMGMFDFNFNSFSFNTSTTQPNGILHNL